LTNKWYLKQQKKHPNMEPASPKNNYHYNKRLQPYANRLRKNMTKGEACLWKYVLRAKNMKGYTFRRQRPILNYIADFACLDLRLVIEVDGISHETEEAAERDRRKDRDLESVGFTVLRFSNWEVLNRIDDVSGMILRWVEENAEVPPPSPRQRGRRVARDDGGEA
jgi:very-short-patch-repair endonuclease